MVFHARQRGKQPFLFIGKAIGNKILIDIRLLFVREYQSKKFVHKTYFSHPIWEFTKIDVVAF